MKRDSAQRHPASAGALRRGNGILISSRPETFVPPIFSFESPRLGMPVRAKSTRRADVAAASLQNELVTPMIGREVAYKLAALGNSRRNLLYTVAHTLIISATNY